MLADFLHYSDTLLAIDLSTMGFDKVSTEYLVVKGLRKARTLTTCVLKGLTVGYED